MADRIDLDELERLERQATPGPWATEPWTCGMRVGMHAITAYGDLLVANVHETDGDDLNRELGDDHPLIVSLRNAAPALVAELRRLRKIEAAAVELKRVRETASDLTQEGYREIGDALMALDGAVEETKRCG